MDRSSPSSSEPVLELAVVAGDAVAVAVLPARGAVTLGRGEECEVRIDHRSVSRRHALLDVGPPLRIHDLGSVNGTFVRDARAPQDTAKTHPLRRLSGETLEIAIGERVSLGTISVVVRRATAQRDTAAREDPAVRSPAMKSLYEQITRLARSTITVLILGETGVGKEVAARAVHARSPRAAKPFLELHCAALPASLLEGELFGHEKHAFTGANQAQPGLLESADGGTIFLDEVGELPPSVQVKLLRVLEDRKVLRIGSRTPRQLDVRFVAATHRDLAAEVDRGTFRADLFQRLDGGSITIPPLRERVAEIGPLTEQFLAAACRTLDRPGNLRIAAEALTYLERYSWPGNVRELRNVIERAAILADGDAITPADLHSRVTGVATGARAPTEASATGGPALEAMSSNELAQRQQILDALERCGGNQTRAAKLLGVSLRTLVNRLTKHRIRRPRDPHA